MIQITQKIGGKNWKLIFTVFLPSIYYPKVQKKWMLLAMTTYTISNLLTIKAHSPIFLKKSKSPLVLLLPPEMSMCYQKAASV